MKEKHSVYKVILDIKMKNEEEAIFMKNLLRKVNI